MLMRSSNWRSYGSILMILGVFINTLYLHSTKLIMAIAIKSIPVLKDKAASSFTKRITANFSKKSSVDFSKQSVMSSRILAKAKI